VLIFEHVVGAKDHGTDKSECCLQSRLGKI
jgi:hypothetical protein